MATRTKLTPFARLFLFLIILIPLAYGGATYIKGEDPIANIKGMINGDKPASSGADKADVYNPQQQIDKLKKENRALKQRVEELEAALEASGDESTRQKWGK